jgi:hypothetical protein
VAQEWFRQPDWDADARAEFESRLSRARPHNRPQHLRIKALALRDAGDRGSAVELLERLLGSYATSLDAAFAAELLGDIARDEGRSSDAARWYRTSLARGTNATSGTAHISLAEVLNGDGAFVAAMQALEMVSVTELTLPVASSLSVGGRRLVSAREDVDNNSVVRPWALNNDQRRIGITGYDSEPALWARHQIRIDDQVEPVGTLCFPKGHAGLDTRSGPGGCC